MTDVPVPGRAEGGRLSRARALLASVLGPFLDTAFRDPVREGRLRLDALSRVERQLARFGLVLLVVLLGSMLLAGWWRRGDVLSLGGSHELNLLPVGVYGLTLLAFFTGFTLMFWGALNAAPTVRLLVAITFGLTMSTLDNPPSVPIIDTWVMRHGPTIVHAGSSPPSARCCSRQRWRGSPGSAACSPPRCGSSSSWPWRAFFLGLLLIHHETEGTGAFGILAFSLDTSIDDLAGLYPATPVRLRSRRGRPRLRRLDQPPAAAAEALRKVGVRGARRSRGGSRSGPGSSASGASGWTWCRTSHSRSSGPSAASPFSSW